MPFLTEVKGAPRRGMRRALAGVWPVPLAVCAILIPILRGDWNKWFLLLELGLLVVFLVIARWTDLRGASEELATKTLSWTVALALSVALLAFAFAVVGNPTEPEDERSGWDGLFFFGLALPSIVAPFVRSLVFPGQYRWRSVIVQILLAAVAAGFAFSYLGRHAAVDHARWHWFVWAFFVLLLAALLLRLAFYAWREPLRICVAIVVLLWGTKLFWQAFVGPTWFDHRAVDIGAGTLLLAFLIADGVQVPPAASEQTGRRWAGVLGLEAAMLSTTALTIACVLATFGKTDDDLPLELDPAGKPPALDYERLAENDHAFAAAFSPILLFPEEDRWEPVHVRDFYEDDATVITWPDGSTFDPAKLRQAACPSSIPSPCLTISIRCPALRKERGREDCDEGPGFRRADDPGDKRARVYVRIVDLDDPRDAAAGQLRIAKRGRYRRDVRWLIQYWYFFYYDEWTTQSLFGDVTQGHEADWEAVTIGFGPRGPLFVGYSAHCGGSWRPWEKVEIERPSKGAIGAHPAVLVGAGSQAMYPGESTKINPDWAGCLPIGGAELSLLTVGLNIRENVGAKYLARSGRKDIQIVTEKGFPMSVPARWGASNGDLRYESEFGKRMGGRRNESGPLTPTHQALWARPLYQIFCTSKWHPKDCPEKEATTAPSAGRSAS
jgi:hypothetical protein